MYHLSSQTQFEAPYRTATPGAIFIKHPQLNTKKSEIPLVFFPDRFMNMAQRLLIWIWIDLTTNIAMCSIVRN